MPKDEAPDGRNLSAAVTNDWNGNITEVRETWPGVVRWSPAVNECTMCCAAFCQEGSTWLEAIEYGGNCAWIVTQK